MKPPQRGSSSRKEPERAALDIEAVLTFYGGNVPTSGSGWIKMLCIHGERKASATVNLEEGAFTCFSCGLKGDAISIIRAQENCGYREACVKYESITGTPVPGLRQRTSAETALAAEPRSYEAEGWLAQKLKGR